MKSTLIRTIIIIFCSIFFVNIASADVVVIVSSDNTLTSLNKKEVRRIFLGKKKKFPGGKKIALIDSTDGTTARDIFYKKIIKKDSAKIKAYWSTMIFSGRGTPPKEVGSDADVVAYVAHEKNAIAYIDAAAVTSNVKVVFTLK